MKGSDLNRARNILETIINSQAHNGLSLYEVKEAIATIKDNLSEVDFTLDFDGAEYRLIKESEIWDIYVDYIKDLVEQCYDLNLDKIPSFISVSIDWEETAKNAYVDGYGHSFSSYDGSEEECEGYYIFRTN